MITLVLVLCTTIGAAQLKRGAYGLQTGINGSTNTVGGVYNLAEDLRLGAILGFSSSSPSSGSSTTTLNIGIGAAYYLGITDNLSSFVGGQIGFGSVSNGGGSSFNICGQYGAEYFFSRRFSVSGYAQLGYSSVGPSGATTSTFGTSMGTALTFYFN
jgi:hypothetical protein